MTIETPNKPTERRYALDDADRAILAQLRQSPRATNRSLAETLSLSEANVSARMRALDSNRVMKILAQRDFRAAGYHVLASVDVNVAGRAISSVAADLAGIDGVGNLSTFMGDPSIMLLAMASSLAQLQSLITDRIAKVEGVTAIETMVFADIMKYESEFANLDSTLGPA